MPRKLNIDRPVAKNIVLPTSLIAHVDLILFSELEGRVPYGAWKTYVEALIREDLRKRGIQA